MTATPVRTRPPRKSVKERLATIRRAWPDAVEIIRPHAGLWAMGLTLMIVGRAAGMVLPGAPKFLIDDAIPNQDMGMLYTIIGVVLVAALVQGAANFALTQTISKAGQRLIADLRIKLHRHVSRLPIRYFDRNKSGEVVSRVLNDVEGVRNLIGTGMVEFLGGLIAAVFAFSILLYLNWQLTLVIGLFIGCFIILVLGTFWFLGPVFRERQEQLADVTGRLTESVGGIRVVKAYNREDVERQVFKTGVHKLMYIIFRTINAISLIALMTSVLLGLLAATILFFGGRQMIAGTMTTGDFISYVLYLAFMIAPLSSVVMIGTQLSEAFAGLERMREVLSVEPEETDGTDRQAIGRIRGNVVFENVWFEYEPGKPVLKNISFAAEPGTVTALVGPSGSGKSTLIGLIAGFHSPTKGRVLVDEQDLSQVSLGSYRSQLGCVLQETFLFAGTIRENILYGKPDATEEQLTEAARLAHCLEFTDKFPDGLDTVIGERGVRLSGGQRQRLAIARALLADPRLLILDEATSALDTESETAIQDGLAQLMAGRTTFVIAHRLSTIRHAGNILVMEEGEVAESGTHKELLLRRGRYFDMYRRQVDFGDGLLLFDEEDEADGHDASRQEEKKRRADALSRILSGE